MITRPTGWKALWNSGNWKMGVSLAFESGGLRFGNSEIAADSLRLTHQLYGSFSVGNACAARLQFTVLDASGVSFPEGAAKATLSAWLANESGVALQSVPQGTYYLDTVERNNDGSAQVVMYDGLALTDRYLYENGVVPSSEAYPKNALSVVTAICTLCGLVLDTRNQSSWQSVSCDAPEDMTCRQVLQSIAAAAGGNWTMTKQGKLRFMRLGAPTTASKYPDALRPKELTQTSTAKTVQAIALHDGEDVFKRGGSGFCLDAECAFASDANALIGYNNVRAKQYQGFKATGVRIDPCFELGDYASVAGANIYIDSCSLTYQLGCWGDVESPLTDEVESRISTIDRRARLNSITNKAIAAIESIESGEVFDGIIDELNRQANETGGWFYYVEGQGVRTYDRQVTDPAVGAEATQVVEVKGGNIRIANSRDASGQWNWRTVIQSGHIAADLVTAVSVSAGYIGSPSGNYWNLDMGQLRLLPSTSVGDTTIGGISSKADSASTTANAASTTANSAKTTANAASAAASAASSAAADAMEEAVKVGGGTNLLSDTNHTSLTKRAADADRYTSGTTSATTGLYTMGAANRPTPACSTAFYVRFASSSSGRTKCLCYYRDKAVKLISGEKYTISCWAKRSGGTASLMFQYGQTSYKASKWTQLGYSWQRVSWTFTFKQAEVGGSNGARLYFYTKSDSATACEVSIAGMKLEIGEKATDWRASPQDDSWGIANASALAEKYTNAISEKDRDYAKEQRDLLDASFNQAKVFNRLMTKTNGKLAKGIVLNNGELYINGTYIQTNTLSAGIIKTGILTDKKGKNRWNMETGYLYTKNAEFYNSTVSGTMTSGSGNKVQMNEGTIRFFNGSKNALTIDGALRFTDGGYGAHMTFDKYLVLRGPTLAVDNRTNGTGFNGATIALRVAIPTTPRGFGSRANQKSGSTQYPDISYANWKATKPKWVTLTLNFTNGILTAAAVN